MLCQLFLVLSTVQANTIADIAINTPSLSTLVTALKAADLVKTFDGHGSFTVFAPTNDAFSALPRGALVDLLKPGNKPKLIDVLTYHVLSNEVFANKFLDGEMLKTLEAKYVTVRKAGQVIFINSAKITITDVTASNGVIHIIDAVLIPPGSAPQPGPTPTSRNLVELASAMPGLSTLVTAVKAGGLAGTLEGRGPFTVFGPSNGAFNALPQRVLSKLLEPRNKKRLADLLTFHVLAGKVNLQDILDGARLKTVEGMYIMAAVNSSGVFLNNAQVITSGNQASNGVLYIIDAVLQEWNPRPTPTPPRPRAKHLWFRGFTSIYGGQYRCGEVDAGPRMPDSLFEPSNKAALRAYAKLTVSLYKYVTPLYSQDVHLELGRCADIGYTRKDMYARKTDWAPNVLMGGICAVKCKCQFCSSQPSRDPCPLSLLPKCRDVPDDPSAGKFCSLCGPKYNKPYAVKTYQCSRQSFPCRGPKGDAVVVYGRNLRGMLSDS